VSKAFSDYNFREVCHLFGLSQVTDPAIDVIPEFICGTIFAIKFYQFFYVLNSIFWALCFAASAKIDGDELAEQCLAYLINDLEVYKLGESCVSNVILD
jgi:hypothetical protein